MTKHRWTEAQKEFIQQRLDLNTKTLYRQFVQGFGNIEPAILSSQASQIQQNIDLEEWNRQDHSEGRA